MANDFYTPSGNPATSSQGSSATMRAEFASIEDGFDKLPVLTGNDGKIVAVNSGGTALEAIANVPVSKGGTGQTTYTDGQLLIGNSSGNTLAKSTLTAGSNIVITNGNGSITISATGSGGGGVGSVTSVAQTFTGGLISVSGSPITTSGTLALTVAGTSGGIPYFSSASTWASSAALTNNAIMLGGGAGGAPKTTTTGTGVVTALGINVGSSGAFVTNGGALGTPSSGTVTNLTGTASININGTVGATTPTTGAFTTVTASTQVVGPAGSEATPSISFNGNTNAGLYISVPDVTPPSPTNEVSVAVYGARAFTFKNDRATMAAAYHQTGTITATGTTPTIASGTATPTVTGVSNVTSSSGSVCQWMRVGNVVTVSGYVSVDATSSGTTTLRIALPIASAFTTSEQLIGAALIASGTTLTNCVCYADATNDAAYFGYTAAAGGARDLRYTYTYQVL